MDEGMSLIGKLAYKFPQKTAKIGFQNVMVPLNNGMTPEENYVTLQRNNLSSNLQGHNITVSSNSSTWKSDQIQPSRRVVPYAHGLIESVSAPTCERQ